MIHKAKMESAADEVFLDAEGLLVHIDGSFNQCSIMNIIYLEHKLSLTLESKTLRMPQFGVMW